MSVQAQIKEHLALQPEPKRRDMEELHRLTRRASPRCKLWFFDGKDSNGRTIANPTIGYGSYTKAYADGTTRESFRIGISANKTGISVYILGIADKTHLARTYGKTLGKAKVTGYCIGFKALKDIDAGVLEGAIREGFDAG